MTRFNLKKLSSNVSVNAIVLFALSLLMVPQIIAFYHYAYSILQYPYVWALTENENMLFIQRIISFEPVYKMKEVESYLYFVYPPFFHLLSSIFIKIFGFTILIPRLISVFSFVLLIILTWLFFKEKINWFENLLVTFLLIASAVAISSYSGYFVLARVDMLAYAFAFFSLYFLWKIVHQNHQSYVYYVLTGVMIICALFTKHSVFFPYIAVALLFIFAKNRFRFFMFGIALMVTTLLMVFLTNLLTHGEFVKSMMLAQEIYGKYLNSISTFYFQQGLFVNYYAGLILGIFLVIVMSIYRVVLVKSYPLFFSVVAGAVYINFFITGGNAGAGGNTMIPVLFCLLLAMKELYFLNSVTVYERFSKVFFMCIMLLQIIMFHQVNKLHYSMPTAADMKNQALLVKSLKQSSSDWVLGDRVDYATILAGKKSPLEASTHNVATEWKNTKHDAFKVEEKLLDRIKNKKINLAVLTITNFGDGDLIDYIRSQGKLINTIKINYMDAVLLDHKIYKFW